jgi:hypothetical protein
MAMFRMNEPSSIALGMVAVSLFATREIVFIFRGQSGNGLWACYVALLQIGVGLMVRSAASNAVGTFWLTVGFPLWIVDMLAAGSTESTSVLTHISGLILGCWRVCREIPVIDSTPISLPKRGKIVG